MKHFHFKLTLASWLLTFLIAIFSGCTQQLKSKSEMEQEFEAEFGFSPTNDVNAYECLIVRTGDSLSTYLSFICDDKTFDRLRNGGFESAQAGDHKNPSNLWNDDILFGDPNAPKWWAGLPKTGMLFSKRWQTEGGMQHYIYFWHDEKSGRVYSKVSDWR